jgi:hypothetical protein
MLQAREREQHGGLKLRIELIVVSGQRLVMR